MEDKSLKIFHDLIRYADKDILKTILCLIDSRKGLFEINSEEMSYAFLSLFANNNYKSNDKKDIRFLKLERLLKAFSAIIENLHYLPNQINNLKRLIKLVIDEKEVIYWKNCTDENAEVYYCNLGDVLKGNIQEKCIKLLFKGGYVRLPNGVKVGKIRKLNSKLKIDKFLTTYKSLAQVLKNYGAYCPWCYPDDKIKLSPKQRRCFECDDIANFLSYSEDDKERAKKEKNLNMRITRIKGNSLDKTIALRGKVLADEIAKLETEFNNKELKNVKLSAHDFTRIKNMVKTKYKLN